MKIIKTKNFVAKLAESILVIGYILFEELIWDVFAKPIFQFFKRLAVLEALKERKMGSSPELRIHKFPYDHTHSTWV